MGIRGTTVRFTSLLLDDSLEPHTPEAKQPVPVFVNRLGKKMVISEHGELTVIGSLFTPSRPRRRYRLDWPYSLPIIVAEKIVLLEKHINHLPII